MKTMGIIFTLLCAYGLITIIGAAGGCDMQTLTLGEAGLKAGEGAMFMIAGTSGRGVVKNLLKKRYGYRFN